MTKEQVEKHQNKGLRYRVFTEGIFSILWIGYLVMFYSYYKEAYFYIDKRLSFLYKLLFFINDNLRTSLVYFLLYGLLITLTFVFLYFLFLTYKRKPYSKSGLVTLVCLNALYIFLSFINIYGVIFFIITILSGSIVYALVMVGKKEDVEEDMDYEEGEIVEVQGPFETETSAQQAARLFMETWQKKETVVLEKELYKEDDNYYVEIYVETIKK